ncbi:hypothetical protein [Sediminibacillus massiliensis]|uniref:hypothetical protein n=1 Tax=Sediminibacillus massiliensis TaxID=1926277 RepID=UPI00098858AD|nr:hypothetical protein [Sediminibacillus massiliensis]
MSGKQGQQIIHCPKCGENKVSMMPIALIIFLSGGCFVWIPILGWIVAPILFLIAIIMWVIPTGKVFMRCESCKHGFSVPKSEYKQYKEAIK